MLKGIRHAPPLAEVVIRRWLAAQLINLIARCCGADFETVRRVINTEE